jgi:hypothetical protein
LLASIPTTPLLHEPQSVQAWSTIFQNSLPHRLLACSFSLQSKAFEPSPEMISLQSLLVKRSGYEVELHGADYLRRNNAKRGVINVK